MGRAPIFKPANLMGSGFRLAALAYRNESDILENFCTRSDHPPRDT